MNTYEQKYKEALENARQEYNITENVERKQWLEELFPELKKSENERIRKEIIEHLECELTCWNVNEVFYKKWIAWLEKQGKEEYALKSSKHEDVYKFMEYIEKRAKSYEFNLPNRGYDIYAFAKDILIWLEKQGQSTFDKCRKEGDRIVENPDGTHFNLSQLMRVTKVETPEE